jgi:hypothetical protein
VKAIGFPLAHAVRRIHPDFRQLIWAAVYKRAARAVRTMPGGYAGTAIDGNEYAMESQRFRWRSI